MTEYTVSSQALREYMTSRERTAYWVKSHEPETAFYSPSAPPTVIDDYLPPSSPPSEVGSVRSIPPKMFLRYNDGRPDQPLPYSSKISGGMTSSGGSGRQRSQPPHSERMRLGSHGTSPLGRSQPRRPGDRPRPPPLKPEEIRILPSQGEVSSPPTSSSRHTRSKSLPRTTAELRPLADAPDVPQVPFFPPPSHRYPTPYQTPPHSAGAVPGQQINFAQPPPRHQQPGRHSSLRQPPAIIYAPSHHANQSHYAPPAILHHPPQMGPNGMIYSHSAPVGSTQYPPAVATPYPSVGGSAHHHSSSLHDGRRGREFYRERGRAAFKGTATRIISPSASSTSLTNSHDSGSTYYVLPTHGQKVHVIGPSREQSVGTATSTTVTSPYAQSFGKRPFFQRLFSFAGKFSSGSSSKGAPTGGRKLHRRHSIGASARPRVVA